MISQHTCIIDSLDTAETVAQKIHQLENEFFPKAINKLISVN
jgi:folate-dependent phosphoribosylglycinamide formyltransferase PurN